ncbi:MAG: diaminopimelate epimerase [Lachnospiraceae bacterium]|nr:diaminopimelate epimerase [Lachnospiraceae bacterium]
MKLAFTKMEGCGNDYVYVNGFNQSVPAEDKPALVRRLSDRHFGIGGDGVIFINPAKEADFEMEMWNADGTRSEMCGNGIRCVARYVYDFGLTDQKEFSIVSAGKVKYMTLYEQDGQISAVRVNMGQPILEADQIPVRADHSPVINVPIEVQGEEYRMTCVSMGNPHAVVFVDSTKDFPLEQVGPYFENHPCFPNRTNTEFVQVIDRGRVRMRVWERGTGETLACGTGCCATAVACVLNGLTDNAITVEVLGGELRIEWDRENDLVWMTGPATVVFSGEIEI